MSDSRLSSMPEAYAAKLRAARAQRTMQGERRVITMLFCDVTGSTAVAEQLDPEEWAEIMNEAFEFMIAPIYKYEGTVARLMGDGLLAFFGAPIAHEDDPQRAVLAALEIVEGVRAFAAEIERDYGLAFDVRVGINTGPVVVGNVGSDLALEYTAMGDAINLAARMESTAVPGTVQISDYTYRLVAPLFDVTEREALTVKGKREPVRSYQVVGPKAQPGRLRGIQGVETPLIGRSAELHTLIAALEDLNQGRGRIIFLLGEAGIGKSRLIEEVRQAWRTMQTDDGASDGRWGSVGAVSYGAHRPYGMIKYQLRQECHIRESDPAPTARAKLENTFDGLPPDLRQRAQQLFAILLGAAQEDGLRPEGEAFQRELCALMLQTTRLIIGGRPMVYVADDLHWGDPASVSVYQHLFQLVESEPVLFLCAMRQEQQTPAWQARGFAATTYPDVYTEIHLAPLPAEDSAALVHSLLDIGDLPASLQDDILSKAEGNPFFIEEVVRALLESGAIARTASGLRWQGNGATEVRIPDTLQALLLARIDRLEKEVKFTLQLASVIGRSFYERVLEMIANAAEALDDHLERLEQMQLIQEAARLPELEYTFRHALTRDAAYRSILHRRRRQFHRRVAEALETLFPDRLDEEAHRLGYHFEEARDFGRALDYYTMAGDHAARLYANTEAAENYGKAIVLARDVGSSAQLVNLYTKRGRTLEVCGRYDDALHNYDALLALGRERRDPQMETEALIAQAIVYNTYTTRYDPEKGRALLEQAQALAEAHDDFRDLARIYWSFMLLGTYEGRDPRESIAFGERALALARKHDLREVLAYVLHDLARPYAYVGELEKGYAALEESGNLWRELGNVPMLADNLATRAGGYSFMGQLDLARYNAEEALALSRSIGNLWGQAYSLGVWATVQFEQGHVEAAIDAWKEAIRLGAAGNFIGSQVYMRSSLAFAYGYVGRYETAVELIAEARQKVEELEQQPYNNLVQATLVQIYLWQGETARAEAIFTAAYPSLESFRSEPTAYATMAAIVAQIDLQRGEYGRALDYLEDAQAMLGDIDVRIYLPELWYQQARALYHLGREDEAHALLQRAREVANDIGTRRQLWPILLLLARLEAERGATAAAEQLKAETRDVITTITDHLQRPGLRQAFLNARPVKRALEQSAASGSS